MPRLHLISWLGLVFCLVLVDQVSKWASLVFLSLHESVAVMPFLNFTLAYNAGAAYGMLSDGYLWQRSFLVGLALIICVILIIWLKRLRATDKSEALAVVLILSGALGNLIDRIRLGAVVDFIDFYVGDWHWYTFNGADVFITVGAALLILGALLGSKSKKN